MKHLRAFVAGQAERADRVVGELVPRRAKPLRVAASPIDLARADPIPVLYEVMSPDERKEVGLDKFADTGLSKRAYSRESGHDSWTHARSLVTPGTERIPTPWDLHVLDKILYVLSIAPKPSRPVVLRSA